MDLERTLTKFLADELASATLLAFVTVTYAMALQLLLRRQRQRRAKRRNELLNVVTNGLKTGSLGSLADMVNVYKGIMHLPSDDLAYRSGLSSFLREYLVALVSGRASPDSDDHLQEWKALVTAWISANELAAPFADVPEVERHLIADIAGFLEAGDTDAIRRKLDQLASSVTVREQDYQRLRALNRWSVPLAGLGLLLTIAFGLASFLR